MYILYSTHLKLIKTDILYYTVHLLLKSIRSLTCNLWEVSLSLIIGPFYAYAHNLSAHTMITASLNDFKLIFLTTRKIIGTFAFVPFNPILYLFLHLTLNTYMCYAGCSLLVRYCFHSTLFKFYETIFYVKFYSSLNIMLLYTYIFENG